MPTPPFLLELLAGKGGYSGNLVGPEDMLVMQMAADLRQWSIEGRLRAVWTKLQPESAYISAKRNTPAEVRRAQGRMAKARAMGAITGAWEFVFLWSDGSGMVEAKSETGRLTKEQRLYDEWLSLCGVRHAIVRRPHELADLLRDWGVLRG